MFGVAWAMGFDIEGAPPMPKSAGPLAAITGVALLIADVFLPIPSSLVMIAHGALFGTAIGALLSPTGSVASALVGFALGRATPRNANHAIISGGVIFATGVLWWIGSRRRGVKLPAHPERA